VEALPTDRGRFAELFPGAEGVVSINDRAALSAALRETLGESARLERMDGERAYVLGNAYLKGFGLERDFDRAIKLLALAAKDSGSTALSAAEQLAGIYGDGIGTGIDYAKALQWRKRAVVLSEEINGKEHPDTARTYNNVAIIYSNQGDYPWALEWNHKALTIQEKALEKEHPDTAGTCHSIASVYLKQSDYPRALEWYHRALAIREQALGKEHPSTAMTYSNIAAVYNRQGDYPRALEWNHKALAIREKMLGKEHPDTAMAYDNIALAYTALAYTGQGDYPRALEWFDKALAAYEKLFGEKHPDATRTRNYIAKVYSKQRKDAHRRAIGALLGLVPLVGGFVTGHRFIGLIIGIVTAFVGATVFVVARKWKIFIKYNSIASVYHNQGDYPRALEWYHKALAFKENAFGKEHPDTATTYNNIAVVCHNQGDYPLAFEWYGKALAVYEKALGREHPGTATIYNNIALVFGKQGDYPRTLEWPQKALAIQEKAPGKEHPGDTDPDMYGKDA
jgi:tetratricopeptide (TPR) repeat protein